MKKLPYLLIIILLCNCYKSAAASAATTSSKFSDQPSYQTIVNALNNYAQDKMKQEIDDWIAVLLEDDYKDDHIAAASVTVGDPFFYFDIKKSSQDAAVNYPLYYKNKIIGIFTLFQENGTWQMSVEGKTEQTDILNRLLESETPAIFYVSGTSECGDVVMIENAQNSFAYIKGQGKTTSTSAEKKFAKYTYDKKLQYISEHMAKFGETVSLTETPKNETSAAFVQNKRERKMLKFIRLFWSSFAVLVGRAAVFSQKAFRKIT